MSSVLLVEPWFAGSHRGWAEGLQRHSRHQIELLSGEPRGWRSTIEQAATELATRVRFQPDLILASSMMDLPQFKAGSGLLDTPALLYMHENQLTYDRAKPSLELGAVNWRSVVAADRVAFNSQFHLDDFFSAVPMLGVDRAGVDPAREKSLVLPVGIDGGRLTGPDHRDGGSPVLIWNHRWEADKDPGLFIDAVTTLAELSFRLILTGGATETDRHVASLMGRLGDRVLHVGFAPSEFYARLLRSSDVVVSAARQEFFGVSIAEAMWCGAVPLVPNHLAYPELLGPELAPDCLYGPDELVPSLGRMLQDGPRRASLRPAAETAAARFDWELIAPLYDDVIDSMV